MPTRRNILAAATAAAAAPTIAPVIAQAAETSALPPIEISTPKEHVRAFLRMLVSLENATVFHMYIGTLEAVLPGRAPVMLVDSTTIIRRQVEVRPEGHHISIWEATVYHRRGESEPLEAFVNPLNGRTVRPFHQREGRGQSLWTDQGSRFLRTDGTWRPSNGGKPFELVWSQAGERIWTFRNSAGVYLKHPLDAENWPLEFSGPDLLYSEKTTSSALLSEFNDPSIVNVSTTYSLNQVMVWWPWLLMGQEPGFLVWNTNGVKLSDPDTIPTQTRTMIESIHPTIFSAGAPWEERVNLWTDYPKMRSPEPV